MDTLATYGTIREEKALLQSHEMLVKRIAQHLQGKFPQSVQLDDLIQAGMLGLLEAIRHYDASKGASFETYANIRIRGHMIDEVRNQGWVPRSVYKNARMIAEATKKVENRLGRHSKDIEISKELGISLQEYYQLSQDAACSQLYSLEDAGIEEVEIPLEQVGSYEPHRQAVRQEIQAYLVKLMQYLPQKERMVLCLYYQRDLNLKEIGAVMDISESRVSQIHSQATSRIRSRISTQVSASNLCL